MKRPESQKLIALSALVLLLASISGVAQSELDSLLEKLASGPLGNTLWQLQNQPADSGTIPALRAAFEKRTDKAEKQEIAVTLLRLGEKADRYFNFLASYASQAINDHTPLFQKYDQDGRGVRGELSPVFEIWCATNHKDPMEVVGIQLYTYPQDVLALAKAGDPRALDLFRRGLESENPAIVALSVQGLGRLNETSALPAIAKAGDRLQSSDRFVISTELPWFGTPEAYQLMERWDPNPRSRQLHTHQIEQTRQDEALAALHRAGKAPVK